MKFKKFVLLLVVVSLFGCASVKQVGDVNMISNRNVDSSAGYEVLETYTTTNKRALKKSKSQTVDDAINETVGSVAGGEYLMNCKIYLIKGKYFAVTGDVWGVDRKELKGFRIGNKVQFTENFIKKQGVLKSFKDGENAVIELENGKTKIIKLENLIIVNN